MADKKTKKSKWDSDQLHFVPVDPKKIKFVNQPKATKKKK